MTNVTMAMIGKDFVGFEVSGHSGYAQQGSDIVCAAISTIAQATIIGVQGIIGIPCQENQSEAYLKFGVTQRQYKKLKQAQILFETMHVVVKNLELQYKDFIKVCTKQVDMI